MKYLSLLLALAVIYTPVAEANPNALDEAIAAEHRTKNSARDKYRNPKGTLEFFQIKPGQTVLEISPGGSGWYTEILGPYLHDNGKLVLGHFDKNASNDYYVRNYKKLVDKLKANPELYGNVELAVFQAPGVYDLGEKNSYDRIVTFRNVHNWMGNGEDEMLKIFKLFADHLKPGGKLGVVEHRLPEDRAKDGAGGYVKESYVIKLAEAAGLKLEGKSEVNANAKDTADYEKGVWTLPPRLRLGDQDREKYLAIGESDRMTLLFVKPE